MPDIARRSFLATAAATAAAGATAAGVVPSASAATIDAGTQLQNEVNHDGSLTDIKHVIMLMQENRSFDQYFGTMRGVRGFGDRTAIRLPNGDPVWKQPTTQNADGYQYPWPFTGSPAADGVSGEILGQCMRGGTSAYPNQHQAWDNGKLDNWIVPQGLWSMGYYTRQDIPFQFALAESYTLLDAYHCSALSATGCNRTMFFSGSIDPAGLAGGPAYQGSEESGLEWETYAETLQNAGVTWKVYQSDDNYGDNAFEYFNQFQGLTPGSPLYPAVAEAPGSGNGADTADVIVASIKADIAAGAFPQVSWIVTNKEYCEHPSATPNDGAYFISKLLNALAEDPETLNSTVLFVNYDENNGDFDHVPPAFPELGTPGEYVTASGYADLPGVEGQPTGLGFRVPLFIVSPWTRGGIVSSEVADHTSILQFLENWTTALGKPAICPNISNWRRDVCSDLVDHFDFAHPVFGLPELPEVTTVIGTAYCDTLPDPSVNQNSMPVQESGSKPAKALPYQPNANLTGFVTGSAGAIEATIELSNQGPHATSALGLLIYANSGNPNGPWPYTLAASGQQDATRTASVEIGAGLGDGTYDLTIIGPNRFLREFTGNASGAGAELSAILHILQEGDSPEVSLELELANDSKTLVSFTVVSNYYRISKRVYDVKSGSRSTYEIPEDATASGWYDFTITVDADPTWSRRFTGRLENGQPSITG